ncbi:putative invertase inhibitor [Papaver somniferum]|uniref:putative invertase inhibitor n=1 Tax=Papaver somniferum TaxID=3469 RepID=UPI000E6FD8CE|nr:putative invertase inhibitor [Papaver somniferum]
MNKSTSLIFLILLLVLNLHRVVANGDVVADLCKNASTTPDSMLSYDFCVSALESNPKSKTSDLFGLGVISMELIANNATNLLPYIGKLLEEGKKERFVKQALDSCLEVYADATRSVEDAITDFKDKVYYDARAEIIGADDYSVACEDTFNERNLTFPLRKQVDDFSHLVSISLVIIDLVESQG